MIEIKTILCPIDFSDHSRRALDHAVTIARWYESTITVLHVCPTVPPAAFGLESPPPRGAVLTPAERERLTTAMARFIEASNAPEIPIEIVIGQSSATASEILKEASAMRADLLVIGTHGRSGFDRLVLGSVTEKVLRKANCPVLTVPAHAPETLGGDAGLVQANCLPNRLFGFVHARAELRHVARTGSRRTSDRAARHAVRPGSGST